ncbi:PWWP domain-containing DNA repair factor 3A isoform X2 [Hoplias malabaricus]|uniref:PWWP domain-containing DNA repair factor 3A isoform X2 n=1 Tax=Hoplias malabaricus TaxID=27720 RepID=UPI0034633F8F
MNGPEESRTFRPRKNPDRMCQAHAEALQEQEKPALKRRRSGKDLQDSREAVESAVSTDGSPPKTKRRGKVKESTPKAAENGPSSPRLKAHEPSVPPGTTECLQKVTEKLQRGRKKKVVPHSDANGELPERLDSCPTIVNIATLAQTEELSPSIAKLKRGLCSKAAVESQTPTETCLTRSALAIRVQQNSPCLRSRRNLLPEPHTPKRSRRRPKPALSSTPLCTAGLSHNPQHARGTPNRAHGRRDKQLQSTVKRRLPDLAPQKTAKSRSPSGPDKPMTRQWKTQEPVPIKRQRGRTKAEPQNSTANRVRARFVLHDSELQDPELNSSSDLSIELSLREESEVTNHSLSLQEEEEDEEELPSFLQQTNIQPSTIRGGLCVWCKFRKYPFWPAVVKSVNHKSKKASIVFIDKELFDKKKIRKGLTVSLKTIKPFDCEEYENFVVEAREQYGDVIDWSLELISDYRIRIGCGSFVGSFIEYFTDDISCPVRNRYPNDCSELTFPSQELLNEEMEDEGEKDKEHEEDSGNEQPDEALSKKILPDRTQAARNRANERLVDFIVKKRGVENRLMAVISGQERSKWLQALNSSSRPVVEVYLEDDGQVEKVYRYLEKLCEEAARTHTGVDSPDRIRFILDVLLPEAIIYAIAGVDSLSLDKAEEKYLQGPRHSNRERQEFDMMIEQQMNVKAKATSR